MNQADTPQFMTLHEELSFWRGMCFLLLVDAAAMLALLVWLTV